MIHAPTDDLTRDRVEVYIAEQRRFVRAVTNLLDAICDDCVVARPAGRICPRHQKLYTNMTTLTHRQV